MEVVLDDDQIAGRPRHRIASRGAATNVETRNRVRHHPRNSVRELIHLTPLRPHLSHCLTQAI